MIAHVVLFTPRADLDATARQALVGALERACVDIPQIRRVRIGRRRILGFGYDALSPVHFEYAAILEFDTEADLRAYLLHPAHAELGQRFTSSAAVAIAHDFEMVQPEGLRALVDQVAEQPDGEGRGRK
jgi:Stress responsive A/B Barrel Domain